MSLSKLFTIGVYGFSEREFFKTIEEAGIETFCDIRRRRGLRGPKYAFANGEFLKRRLAEMDIRYLHFKDLAPSQSLIQLQGEADVEKGIPRRERSDLSKEFVEGYKQEVLNGFDAQDFMKDLGPNCLVVALFCVEGEPEACHRSLVASKLSRTLKIKVEHLVPG